MTSKAYKLPLEMEAVAWDNKSSWMWKPGGRFSKAPETFRARKAIAKSRTLQLQSCFNPIFWRWREVPFIQEVSGVYTSPFLDTDELKMALWARKVFGSFEKQVTNFPSRLSQLMMWSIDEIIYLWTANVAESEEWFSRDIFQFKDLGRTEA